MECVSWCTTAQLKDFEVALEAGAGTFNVSCPAGTKVLGCHVFAIRLTLYEVWRSFYPTSDGSACTCYDYYGAVCYATCASNILDYEVIAVSGSGDVVSSCMTPGNAVFGCGAQSYYSNTVIEMWRETYVLNMTSCLCHDVFWVKCFAVCGKFY